MINLRPARSLPAIVMIVTVLVSMVSTADAQPQRPPTWSPPVVVSPSVDREVYGPRLAIDSSGAVHVFFSSRPLSQLDQSQGTEVVYTRLHAGKWSEPRDIHITAPGGPSVRIIPAIDRHDIIHLLWTGGPSNALLYSRAHVAAAESTQGWSPPRVVSETTALNADLVASKDGLLHMVYASAGEDVYYRQSTDLGETWSFPIPISDLSSGDRASDYTSLATDGSGTLHVMWSQLQMPRGWPPTEIAYSRSLDNGGTWGAPLVVDSGQYSQSTVVSDGSVVHMVWNSIVQLSQRKHSMSRDGGSTWTRPRLIETRSRGGLTGPPGLALDSIGRLHMVTALDLSGINYLPFTGINWSALTLLSQGAVGEKSIEQPAMAIGSGNRLHVVYEDDFARIWYTTATLDSPSVYLASVPTPIPASSQVGLRPPMRSTLPRVVFDTPLASAEDARTDPDDQSDSLAPGNQALLSGLGTVAALVGMVVVVALRASLRRTA
jgi:hypothetical protein